MIWLDYYLFMSDDTVYLVLLLASGPSWLYRVEPPWPLSAHILLRRAAERISADKAYSLLPCLVWNWNSAAFPPGNSLENAKFRKYLTDYFLVFVFNVCTCDFSLFFSCWKQRFSFVNLASLWERKREGESERCEAWFISLNEPKTSEFHKRSNKESDNRDLILFKTQIKLLINSPIFLERSFKTHTESEI